VILLAFPAGLVEWLGIPPAAPAFYPGILGAVLFGIGLALLIEAGTQRGGGLGLRGAVAINLCGGVVLGAWLVFGNLALPVRGVVVLWALVVVLVGLSTLETVRGVIRRPDSA
jgi:hypothetical protein